MNRLLLIACLALMTAAPAPADEPNYSRQEVIYGRKFGTALTMDVFRPDRGGHGGAVVFVVSGGWYSNHSDITPNIPVNVQPFVEKGYAVFAVCHGSNPKFALPEILGDLHRSVRYIRHQARDYGVDPDRIGITGDSAGGHLALMIGCTGGPGDPKALDPVDRESSRVGAVVAFYPPTDFLNWGEPGRVMLGTHPIVPVQGAFDFHRLDPATNSFRLITDPKEREAIGREVSPIAHVGPGVAPTLIVHGDKDALVPLQQSRDMASRLREAGVPSELLVVPGGEHDAALVRGQIPRTVGWFDKYLVKPSKDPGGR